MLQAAPLGRALPLRPLIAGPVADYAAEHDLGCATAHPTPRPASAVNHLAGRILTGTMLARLWTIAVAVAFALWMLGTAVALLATTGSTPILVLGFGGLATGLAGGSLWIRKRSVEAQRIAREGQLVVGIATYGRSCDALAMPLSDTQFCIVFSIGFIPHEVWVALPSPPDEGERFHLLIHPGARDALVFDRFGDAHVGDLRRLT